MMSVPAGSGSGGHDSFGDQEEKANTGEKAPDQNDEPNASQRQGQSRNASAGVAEAGTKGAAQHRGEGDNPNPQVSSQVKSRDTTKPFCSHPSNFHAFR